MGEDALTELGPLTVARVRRQMVYRVGFGPRPWQWTPWDFAVAGRFDGRWDDPDGVWRTLYVADSPLGCYLEVLARFRRDPGLVDALAEIDDDPDHPTLGPGLVPAEWRTRRRLARASMSGVFVVAGSSSTLATLRRHFLTLARRLGLSDVDAAAVRIPAPRAFTQAVAKRLYSIELDDGESVDGVEFASRHGDEHALWAIFERARDTVTSAVLAGRRSSAIEADDAELVRAMEIHQLAWA